MNQEMIQYIMQRMAEWLDNRQMIVLQNTLHNKYAMVKQSNVKSAHRKYIG